MPATFDYKNLLFIDYALKKKGKLKENQKVKIKKIFSVFYQIRDINTCSSLQEKIKKMTKLLSKI
jgi:hypothetical protein